MGNFQTKKSKITKHKKKGGIRRMEWGEWEVWRAKSLLYEKRIEYSTDNGRYNSHTAFYMNPPKFSTYEANVCR